MSPRPTTRTPCRHYRYSTAPGAYAGEIGPLCAHGVDLTVSGAWAACMPLPVTRACEMLEEQS